MDRYRALAELSDAEADRCLSGVLRTVAAQDRAFADALGSPEALAGAIAELGRGRGAVVAAKEPEADARAHAVRTILLAAADDADLAPRLDAVLTSGRAKRFDPITASLVLGGVVMLLSTKFSLSVDHVNGKTEVHFHAEKKPTPPGVLQKFFGLFGGA